MCRNNIPSLDKLTTKIDHSASKQICSSAGGDPLIVDPQSYFSFQPVPIQTGSHIPQPLLHQWWSTGWTDKQLNGSTMKDRSNDQSHHEQTLLPRSSSGEEYTPSCVAGYKKESEMFYLTTHSTHFIHGYMATDIWLRTILIVRKETHCRHIGYSYRLTARVLLYAPSHRQDNTYHSLCYTSCGALAGTRNSSMGPPHEGSIRRATAP